jgi:hypothetical protein
MFESSSLCVNGDRGRPCRQNVGDGGVRKEEDEMVARHISHLFQWTAIKKNQLVTTHHWATQSVR